MKAKIQSLIELLEKSIHENPEQNILGGNIIKDGYDEQVDHYRGIIQNSSNWLDSYRAELIEKTGIQSLKIKYTNVSGYFIEIPKGQIPHITDDFIHKQTLVSAARYVTDALINFEKQRSEAHDTMATREYEIFSEIREKILKEHTIVRSMAHSLGNLDCQAGLAQLAYNSSYTKPVMSEGYDMAILGGRHPVIETMTPDFISNDLEIGTDIFTHIITGPNMGGKSTFLRQNALIILLAHIGSYVPARSATIPITDKLFSRIGASDNLYLGQSTFMVEMQEVANILHNATRQSFVIIDEVGRGTSTYDGMSIAWAIIKENHDNIQAKTLFSTHYHELCDEAKQLPGVKNFSVAVGENSENIVFLRKIIPGMIHKSYGLEVARLAGMNKRILREAEIILEKFQMGGQQQLQLQIEQKPKSDTKKDKHTKMIEKIKNLQLETMTPFDALMTLKDLQEYSLNT